MKGDFSIKYINYNKIKETIELMERTGIKIHYLIMNYETSHKIHQDYYESNVIKNEYDESFKSLFGYKIAIREKGLLFGEIEIV